MIAVVNRHIFEFTIRIRTHNISAKLNILFEIRKYARASTHTQNLHIEYSNTFIPLYPENRPLQKYIEKIS